ncbi:MAG TPA: protein kinase [Bryobacteraceae bacterium]|nr:protein kinase [Bryobacteraceae bacterium]
MALAAGTKLGPYEILAPIGAGGMGEVYSARDTRLERTVALKLLPAGFAANPERKQRLMQEAHATSALNHPNIVTIHDIGQQNGADFIVMEYIEGRALDQLIAAGALKIPQILEYSVRIADALARAHTAGIVHRDLKPGNIMIANDGQVKLLDFGLAKWTVTAENGEPVRTVTMVATEIGTVVGTVAYMSPEQAEGLAVDSRSDIFSFGAVMYEMVTGQRPFAGNSKLSIMAAIVSNEPKPPRELASSVPRDLERIILRCLRKDPAWRYQSAADLRISLADVQREIAAGVPAEAAPPALRWSSRPGWILALGAGAAAVALGAWWLGARNPAPSDSGYLVRPLTTYSGIEQYPALSPDGKQIAFTWDGDNLKNDDIYVRSVAGGPALRLTNDPGRDILPTWSPDGETIAFARVSGDTTTLHSVRALGGSEHKLFEFPNGRIQVSSAPESRISWSPDGKLLGFSGAPEGEPSQIWLLPLDTREPRRISDLPKGWAQDDNPAFSPDGRTLAYVRRRDLFSRAILFQSIGKDGSPVGPPREMTDYTRIIGNMAWLPDGRSLVTGLSSEVWPTLWRFTPGQGFHALGLYSGVDPSVALKGNRMAYTSYTRNRNVYRMDGPGPEGKGRRFEECHVSTIIDSTVGQSDVMLSPNGSRIAFVSSRTGYREVYVANADGSNQEALTSMGPANLGSPRWSPDGHWIAFDRYENGHSVIYAIRAEGGQPRRLTNPEGSDTRPSWSHDGKWIYFSSNRGGRGAIWKLAWANPETVTEVAVAPSANVFEAPDGKQLFYGAPSGIWIVPSSGGEPKLIAPNVLSSHWAVAGHSLYYFLSSPAPSLWVLRLETGERFEYVRFAGAGPSGGGTSLTVSQDEKLICFAQNDRYVSDLTLVENFR